MSRGSQRDSTARLFAALSDPEVLAIVAILETGPKTQKQIREQLAISSGSASRRMATLESVGLVARERSHAPYELTLPQLMREMLEATAELLGELPTYFASQQERRRTALIAGGQLTE